MGLARLCVSRKHPKLRRSLFLSFAATGAHSSLIESVVAAHEIDLPVVALTGGDGGEISTLLNHGDTEIRVNSDHPTTVREQHLMLVHCLSELIDLQIFG